MTAATPVMDPPLRRPPGRERADSRPTPADDLRRRAAALAEEQRLFRYANERVLALGAAHEIALICECPRRDCFRFVELTPAAYEQAQAEPDRFVVLPGHESPELHDVVTRGDSWLIVRPCAIVPAEAGA